jgi:hypothetical protein
MLDWVSRLRRLGRAMCLFRRPLRLRLPRLRQLVLMTVMAPAEETGEVVQVAVSESALSIDDGVVAFELQTAGQSG